MTVRVCGWVASVLLLACTDDPPSLDCAKLTLDVGDGEYCDGELIHLNVTGLGKDLAYEEIEWRDNDDLLGYGNPLSSTGVLLPGSHTITVEVKDGGDPCVLTETLLVEEAVNDCNDFSVTPESGTIFVPGTDVLMEVAGKPLCVTAITWSEDDTQLGSGNEISLTLEDGTHWITVTVETIGQGTCSYDRQIILSDETPVERGLPDTGQDLCYNDFSIIDCPINESDPFYGQDAQYVTIPMTYTDNVDTITDSVTGLVWPKGADYETYNWYQASGTEHPIYNGGLFGSYRDVCGEMTLADLEWRLPTRRELLTIMDYGSMAPTVDTTYFTNAPFDRVWTIETVADNINDAWCVSFNDASVTGFQTMDAWEMHVLCVSGRVLPTSFFVDNYDGTVTDTAFGLMWQQETFEGFNWQGALAYCENLTFAGHDDWKLPDVKELETLVDVTRYWPAINTEFFPFINSDRYVTSTPSTIENAAWQIDFTDGSVTYFYKFEWGLTRCVRVVP